jgi:sugar phosphate isomerase/epimerase
MKLGIDSYTLRWQRWNAHQLIDYSAGLGLDVVHLGRGELGSLDESNLREVKAHADDRGIGLELAMGSIDRWVEYFRAERGSAEEQFRELLPVARALGSPIIACSLGGRAERAGNGVPWPEHLAEVRRVLLAVAPDVRASGIKATLETHGDFLARELKALIEDVGPDVVGVCLDTGNPVTLAEDPVVTTEVLASYTLTSHVRDSRVWLSSEGAVWQWVPMGQGNVDLHRIVAILQDQAPEMTFNLETLTASPPRLLPLYQPDAEIWRLCPDALARDFVRYVALAKSRRAEEYEQVLLPAGQRTPPDGELGERLIEQQRRHFEESVRYCQDVLGLGESRRRPGA